MLPENQLAWHIYNLASPRDRQISMGWVGYLPTTAILQLCEAYGATLEDFEKIIQLDKLLHKPGGEGDGENQDTKQDLEKQIKKIKADNKKGRKNARR